MKKLLFFICCTTILCWCSNALFSQCPLVTSFSLDDDAPVTCGSDVSLGTCFYANEYGSFVISGTNNETYCVASSITTDFMTVYAEDQTTVIGSGPSDGTLCFTIDTLVQGNIIYVQTNLDAACGGDSNCRELTVSNTTIQGCACTIPSFIDLATNNFVAAPIAYCSADADIGAVSNDDPATLYIPVAVSSNTTTSFDVSVDFGGLASSATPPGVLGMDTVNNNIIFYVLVTDADIASSGGTVTVTYVQRDGSACTGILPIDVSALDAATQCPPPVCDLNDVAATVVCTGTDIFSLDVTFTGTDADGSYTILDNQSTAALAGQDTTGTAGTPISYGAYTSANLPITLYVESSSAVGCIDSVVVTSAACTDICNVATSTAEECIEVAGNYGTNLNCTTDVDLTALAAPGTCVAVTIMGETETCCDSVYVSGIDTTGAVITYMLSGVIDSTVYVDANQPFSVNFNSDGSVNRPDPISICWVVVPDCFTPPACDVAALTLIGVCATDTSYSVDVTFTGTATDYTISDGTNTTMVTAAGTYNTDTDFSWALYETDTMIVVTDNSQAAGTVGCSQIASVVSPDCSCFGNVPINDECATATSLTTGVSCTGIVGTTTCSSQSQAGCSGTANDDVWYSFVAGTINQDIMITNTGGSTDIVTEVFSGDCGTLTQITCQDFPNSPINLTGLTVGDTYYFRIYTFSSTATIRSDFEVCVVDIVCDLDNINATVVCTGADMFNLDVTFTGTDVDGSYTISDNQVTAALAGQDTTGTAGTPISYGAYTITDLPVTLYVESNSVAGCLDSVVITAAASCVAGATCDLPVVATTLPFCVTGENTSNYGDDYSGMVGTCTTNGYLNGDDYVIEYTPTSNTSVNIDLTNITDNYAGVFVLDACPSTVGFNCIDGAFNGLSADDVSIEQLSVMAGMTYYIIVSTWAAPQSTGFDLCISENFCDLGNVAIEAVCIDGTNLEAAITFTGTDADGSYTISDNIGTAPLAMQDTTGLAGDSIPYGSYATSDLPVTIYVESNSAVGCIDSVVIIANPCDEICIKPTSTTEECVIVPGDYGTNLNCTTDIDLTDLAAPGTCVAVMIMGETETCCDSVYVSGIDTAGMAITYMLSGVIDTTVFVDANQPFSVNFNSDGSVNGGADPISICWAVVPGCFTPPACDVAALILTGVCATDTSYSVDVTFTGTATDYTISDGTNTAMVTAAGTYNTDTDFGWALYETDTMIVVTDNSQAAGTTGCLQTASVVTPDCTCFPPPSIGTTCADAQDLTGMTFPIDIDGLTTECHGDDYDGSTITCTTSFYLGGEDYVFTFTPSEDCDVNIALENTAAWTGFFVFDGCPDTDPNCIGDAVNSGGNPSTSAPISLVTGQQYYIVISTFPAPDFTPFDILITKVLCDLDNVGAAVACTDTDMFGLDVTFTGTDMDGSYTISDNKGTAALAGQDTTGTAGAPINYGMYTLTDLPITLYVESNSAVGCIDSVVVTSAPCTDICNVATSTTEECIEVSGNYANNLNCTTDVDLTSLAAEGSCVAVTVMGTTEACCDSVYVSGIDTAGMAITHMLSGVLDTIVYVDANQPFSVNFNSDITTNGGADPISICWVVVPDCFTPPACDVGGLTLLGVCATDTSYSVDVTFTGTATDYTISDGTNMAMVTAAGTYNTDTDFGWVLYETDTMIVVTDNSQSTGTTGCTQMATVVEPDCACFGNVPANNLCDGAIDVTLTNGNYSATGADGYNNLCADNADGLADPTCWLGNDIDQTVWFCFTADGDSTTIETTACGGTGSSGTDLTDTQVQVYETPGGTTTVDCMNIAEVSNGCDEDEGTLLLSLVNLTTVPGQEYCFVVDGYNANEGDICFDITTYVPPVCDLANVGAAVACTATDTFGLDVTFTGTDADGSYTISDNQGTAALAGQDTTGTAGTPISYGMYTLTDLPITLYVESNSAVGCIDSVVVTSAPCTDICNIASSTTEECIEVSGNYANNLNCTTDVDLTSLAAEGSCVAVTIMGATESCCDDVVVTGIDTTGNAIVYTLAGVIDTIVYVDASQPFSVNFNSDINTNGGADPISICWSVVPDCFTPACTPDGCTDPMACNFDIDATCDDGSCSNADPGTGNTDICAGDTEIWNPTTCSYDVDVTQVLGCTDMAACNYDATANCNDSSCSSADPMTGNTDICAGDTEVWNAATCSYDVDVIQVNGCTDMTANNYDATANCNMGCTYDTGCTDVLFCNYDETAIMDDGSCSNADPMTGNTDICAGDTEVWNETTCSYDVDVTQVLGCTDMAACNYDAAANCDDSSCDSSDPGTGNTNICMGDTEAWNPTTCSYDIDVMQVLGCTDMAACNYDATANCDDSSCDSSDPGTGNTDICMGDTEVWNPTTCSYDIDVVQVNGCTDMTATNYDPTANCNMGCEYEGGCTDPTACNYNENAVVDDGSCNNDDPMTGNTDICMGDTEVWNATTCSYDIDVVQVLGCTNSTANNYDATANCDDNSCTFNEGCTDIAACNYDANAVVDDGSCNNDDPMTGNTDICMGDTEVWNATTCSYDVDVTQVLGCTNETACNYNAAANCDDTSCNFDCLGCTDICAPNYNSGATVDDGSCLAQSLGCTDPTACNYDMTALCDDSSCNFDCQGCTDVCSANYNSGATVDDGSCTAQLLGCTNATACNYDATALCDDASCDFSCQGCTDVCSANYNATATVDDGSCSAQLLGCTDATACNYDATALCDDASCDFSCYGCTDACSVNYDPTATIDDGSCLAQSLGCTDATACNYDATALCDDASCDFSCLGCTDVCSANYDATATIDDGSCMAQLVGCTDANACNYDANALCDDSSCDFDCLGCTDICSANYDATATIDNGSCLAQSLGCTNAAACNYDATALCDDASCDFSCLGCTDACSPNYDSTATIDDGSCLPQSLGCTSIAATNYDANALCDDGTCVFPTTGCTDVCSANYNPSAATDDGSCTAQLLGCTDATACNYDMDALCDDSSCDYSCQGCTDVCSANYDATATIDDGSCMAQLLGCTNASACNYDATALCDDASCDFSCYGCTDMCSANYDATATIDDGSCLAQSLGCTDATATNYDATALCNDESCIYPAVGCTDICSPNYNAEAMVDDGSCMPQSLGCTNATACNYDATALCDDSSCDFSCYGCTDECSPNYDMTATIDDNSCLAQLLGCTDVTATNYDATALCDDSSCVYPAVGCTDICSPNYNAEAMVDDGTCMAQLLGCTNATACNYDATALCDDSSCDFSCYGCTDECSPNYDVTATIDDNSCTAQLLGCTDPTALNYISAALCDDDSCIYPAVGCTDICSPNYNPDAMVDDGSCMTSLSGCTDAAACNYDATALCNDNSCNYSCLGCTNECSSNYNPDATVDNGSCLAELLGCTDANACNYDAMALCDDASCNFDCLGCTDICAPNYNPEASTDDGSCMPQALGCTDAAACNYDADALCDDSSCDFGCQGCTDICSANYDVNATEDDGSCSAQLLGCTDPTATNYDATALCDDGSCIAVASGCTDAIACNYNENANTDDGSCDYGTEGCTNPCNPVSGCTDATACNYDATACVDDSSCDFSCYGCTDICATNYNGGATIDDGSCALALGCTDATACNYDATALCDDGSCDLGNSACSDPCNPVTGCTDASACNYDATACIDNGSCDLGNSACSDPCNPVSGCTDANACNYDSTACVDDGSCDLGNSACSDPCNPVSGCTDASACNYNATACIDNGSCDLGNSACSDPCNPVSGCTDANACNYDATACIDNGSCDLGNSACSNPCNPVSGCTDATACNYDATACVDDSSCEYESCALGSIESTVFVDTNGNGILDAGEETIADVIVVISGDNYNNLITTGADGYFFFDNIPVGTYQIDFILPEGYRFDVGVTQLSIAEGVNPGVNMISGAVVGGSDEDAIPVEAVPPCDDFVVVSKVFCDELAGTYEVLLTYAGGSPTATGYTILDNATGATINTTQTNSLFGPYPLGSGYSFTVSVANNPDCSQTTAVSVVSCTVTAIELLRFDGQVQGDNNLLSWTTASEIDADYFTLEKSLDGVNFTEVTKVDAAGNSNVPQNYSYLDTEVTAGVTYYRLSETDIEGVKTIASDVIALSRDANFEIVNAVPIPTSDFVNLSFQTVTDGAIVIKVYDVTGRTIETQTTNATIGLNTITLDVSAYAAGAYFVQMTDGNTEAITRIVKEQN